MLSSVLVTSVLSLWECDQPAPPVWPCLPRSLLARRFQAVLCRQHGTCGLCVLSIWHPAAHELHAKRRLRPPKRCGWCVIGFVVRRSAWLQVVDVDMYVWCCVLCVLWCRGAVPEIITHPPARSRTMCANGGQQVLQLPHRMLVESHH